MTPPPPGRRRRPAEPVRATRRRRKRRARARKHHSRRTLLLVALIALPVLVLKLGFAGAGLALIETVSAKMRIFRAPEFLATAFLLATLGMLTHFLLET